MKYVSLNVILTKLNEAYSNEKHFVWVLFPQVIVKGLLAIKFLCAARLLGPIDIGLVAIALLTIAIAETLTETGLRQAVIQKPEVLNKQEASAVWTLQTTRGLFIGVIIFSLSDYIAVFFNEQNAASLIAFAAVASILRSSISPGVFLAQRDRNFRKLALIELPPVILDLATTFTCIFYGYGAFSLILGTILGESLKLLIGWFLFRIDIQLNFNWKVINNLINYGKWIWGGSLVTAILNQADKILVGKFLGTSDLGLYQVAAKIAQLLISDSFTVLGQYLFPNFAHKHNKSVKKAQNYLYSVAKKAILILLLVVFLVFTLAEFIVSYTLGNEWMGAVPILKVLSISMIFSGLIAILVPYYRGIGKPKYIFVSTCLQLVVLIICAPLLLTYYGAVGMAYATLASIVTSTIFLITLQLKNGSL